MVALATGKQAASVVLAIGTPGPELENTVLGRLRTYAIDHPEDQLVVWREHSAAGFEDHPVDCAHCWELATPPSTTSSPGTAWRHACPRRCAKHRSGVPASVS